MTADDEKGWGSNNIFHWFAHWLISSDARRGNYNYQLFLYWEFFFFFQKQKKNEKKNVLNSVLENVLVSDRIIISLLVIKHSKHNSSSV